MGATKQDTNGKPTEVTGELALQETWTREPVESGHGESGTNVEYEQSERPRTKRSTGEHREAANGVNYGDTSGSTREVSRRTELTWQIERAAGSERNDSDQLEPGQNCGTSGKQNEGEVRPFEQGAMQTKSHGAKYHEGNATQ
ncbi:hypothetical protein R1flu_016873 [Riccia fluitans]|uniref:Uncharacterized protein n=1 Tax=Riccia fluitans TaxID=41844 RepID=A0ABD1YR42_9MARC